jgi:carboxymethylenebutenolidase
VFILIFPNEEEKMQKETRREFMKKAALGTMALSVIHANPSAAQNRREIKIDAPKDRPAMPYEAMMAETVNMHGDKEDLIDAYLARPMGSGPYPGVVVIHHMPGWDEATKEIARKFAYYGYVAISPNLHYRERKGTPSENSVSVRAAGGMPDDRTMGDVKGAMAYLRTLPYLNGKVGIIGYCSGGRQVYLAACTLPGIDAAIDCYGGGVVARPGELTERQPVAPIDYTKDLRCPLLGLFGKEDKRPSPEDVAKTEAELKKWGKRYEFHMYDNAGHSFFTVDRPSYRVEAAMEGWKQVFRWFEKYLR